MKDRNINKKINYSLELLRFILSFWVVSQHCYKKTVRLNKGRFHVPTFMIISFYFYYKTLKFKSVFKIVERFQRILIPFIIWSIFIFINNNVLFTLFGFSQFNYLLPLKRLIYQLIFGSDYHLIFYYQFVLIFITLLFTIIAFIFKKNSLLFYQISLIISYIFQYSYWNFYFFNNYTIVIKYSLGHIVEFIPFATSGLTLGCLNIITNLKKYKKLAIFFSTSFLFLILKYEIFVRINGFWYPGIILNIGGICVFVLFSLFSFKNKLLILVLKIITKFTGGIYYIHIICFLFLEKKILFIKKRMSFHCPIIVYIISYIICYLGNKMSGKTKLKLLFN